MLMTNC